MKIEILGSGSEVCRSLFGNALEALRESGRKGKVVVVRSDSSSAARGITARPVLIIDGVVKFSGRLVSCEEIGSLLQPAIRRDMQYPAVTGRPAPQAAALPVYARFT